jgi:hypothetical protein
MDGAVHRLHCRVREERDLIGRLDLGDTARYGAINIAGVLRKRPPTAADVAGHRIVDIGIRWMRVIRK